MDTHTEILTFWFIPQMPITIEVRPGQSQEPKMQLGSPHKGNRIPNTWIFTLLPPKTNISRKLDEKHSKDSNPTQDLGIPGHILTAVPKLVPGKIYTPKEISQKDALLSFQAAIWEEWTASPLHSPPQSNKGTHCLLHAGVSRAVSDTALALYSGHCARKPFCSQLKFSPELPFTLCHRAWEIMDTYDSARTHRKHLPTQ